MILWHNNNAAHFNNSIHESAFYFGKNASPLSRVWEMCRNIRGSYFSVRSLKERTFLIITFCGHAEVSEDKETLQEQVFLAIKEVAAGK